MMPAGLYGVAARAVAPRKPTTVSEWADANRKLSSKASSLPGRWSTARNPLLKEPMDCMSVRSLVQEVVVILPIQFGKSEFETNVLGYSMCENPGPIMVVLPGEVSMDKFINQKLNPLLDETDAVRESLTSTASRNASNTRGFKDFAGGQLYIEHAGNSKRLKSTSAKLVLADEFDSFAASLTTGDDPDALLDGRHSAFPSNYKRASVGTPEVKGLSRLEAKWEKSDQRMPHVPCPHCDHRQALVWEGFHWTLDHTGRVSRAWYTCQECGADIDEHHKDWMTDRVEWVPQNPGASIRGYRANFLYYRFALGPRWAKMAQDWLDAQGDPARLKTFINDRRAEGWEDPAMRAVRHNAIRDRAEPYALRTAPAGVLSITAGVDTQDNRLAVQIVGWGQGMTFWTLDYVELAGDPATADVWAALAELLNRSIQREDGGPLMVVEAVAIDAGGHRTEAVKTFVRERRVRRPLCVFGAVPNNAPILSKGKMVDVTYSGRLDKRGVMIHHVGTVAAKHWLFSRLSTDASAEPADRLCHTSDQLPDEFFTGLTSETYDPRANRFIKKRGARNEPLDTWVYAYAAAHHSELRLHRRTRADWEAVAKRLAAPPASGTPQGAQPEHSAPTSLPQRAPVPTSAPIASSSWSSRL